MANIVFKKGSYNNFKTSILDKNAIEDGALYLTEDEGGLYLGKVEGTTKSVKRIQGSVLYFESLAEFTSKIAPPYSQDVLYFIADKNSLVRWDGAQWIIINATAADVTDALTNLSGQIDKEIESREAKDEELLALINTNIENIGKNSEAINSKANQSALDTEIAQRQALAAKVAENTSAASNAMTVAQAAQTAAKSAQDAADVAQGAANSANENANSRVLQTDYDEHVEDFETFKTSVSDQYNEYNSKFTNINNRLQDIDQTNESQDIAIAGKLNLDGLTAMAGNLNLGQNKITNLAKGTELSDAVTLGQANEAIDTINESIKQVSNKANTNNQNIVNLNNRVDSIEADLEDTGIDLKNKQIVLENNLNANGKKITGLENGKIEDAQDTDAATVGQVKSAIAANDAMTFKGTVGGIGSTVANLPTSEVQKGDTYKVATAGKYANIVAKVGDLFINVADDNATPNWTHVSSGYEDDYLQKFVTEANEDNKSVAIHLTNGVNHTSAGSVSSFIIDGDVNSNLELSTSGNVITVKMTWGSFN